MKTVYHIYHGDILLYTGIASDYEQRLREHRFNLHNEKSKKYNFKLYEYIREHNLDWDDLKIVSKQVENVVSKRNLKFMKNEFYETIHSKELKIQYYEHIQKEIFNNQIYYKTTDGELYAIFQ